MVLAFIMRHAVGGRAAAAGLLLIAATACGDPAEPSPPDLRGNWDFTFAALGEASCPGGPGPVPGCAGSGRIGVDRTSPQIAATHSYRAACQSCRAAFEYGVTEQALPTARLSGATLEFELAGCRFSADASDAAQTIAGTTVCTVDQATGTSARGTWTMSRR